MKSALMELFRLKKRPLIATGVILAFTIGLHIFTYYHQTPAIGEAQVKWNDLRRRVAVAGQGDVTVVYKQGKADLETLKVRMPLKRQFPRVLGDVLDAAAANRVTTGNITYKPQVIKDEHLLAYGVSMNIGGSYAAVKSFLSDILNNRELVVVEGFSLSNNDTYEEFVTMDLHLTVYLREGA